jgi:hypothetical protein
MTGHTDLMGKKIHTNLIGRDYSGNLSIDVMQLSSMELKESLLCSQERATEPYLNSD